MLQSKSKSHQLRNTLHIGSSSNNKLQTHVSSKTPYTNSTPTPSSPYSPTTKNDTSYQTTLQRACRPQIYKREYHPQKMQNTTTHDIFTKYMDFRNACGSLDYTRLLAIVEDLLLPLKTIQIVGNIFTNSTTSFMVFSVTNSLELCTAITSYSCLQFSLTKVE